MSEPREKKGRARDGLPNARDLTERISRRGFLGLALTTGAQRCSGQPAAGASEKARALNANV